MDTVLLFRKRTPLTDDRLPWLRGSGEHPWIAQNTSKPIYSDGFCMFFCGEGGWISERNLCLPGLPPILILPDNASRKEALAILSAKLDGKET